MSDLAAIVLIALAWSGAVGVVALLVDRLVGRDSLRWLPARVAVVAIGAVVAGVVGTSQAMFLSGHDFGVVLVVLLVAAIVALVFALLAGASVVRSSRLLREQARRFGESGEFTSPGIGTVELRELSEELLRTSDRLRDSRDRERRLEESRRELVSWVSHDLRTPLAGLRAMTEALEDDMVDDPARYHRRMRREVDRMTLLVEDLFTLSRIQSGTAPLRRETVMLGDLVSETLAGADPVARGKDIGLAGSVEEGLLVTGDPGGLSRVVANLVMNAIYYTPVAGTVRIAAEVVGDTVELAVSDSCGGIPAADLGRVFDVAWRGTHARTPAPGEPGSGRGPATGPGAGLGLAIVRGIVEAHQGSVSVHNEADGCRFLVRLPAGAPAPAPSPAPSSAPSSAPSPGSSRSPSQAPSPRSR